jgi:hypothetical protein
VRDRDVDATVRGDSGRDKDGIKTDYRRMRSNDPPVWNSYGPWLFRIVYHRRTPVSRPRFLLHSDLLDFALTDLGLHFPQNSGRWRKKPSAVALAS